MPSEQFSKALALAVQAHLAQAPAEMLRVSGAEKLHNARAIVADLITLAPLGPRT